MQTLLILAVIACGLVLISRAAGNPLQHSMAYRLRRLLNWLPLGLNYAFLYMGRYNITESKNAFGALMSKQAYGTIYGAGAVTYGCSFLLNGPLTDRIGGKRAMLISAFGSGVMNTVLGVLTYFMLTRPSQGGFPVVAFAIAFALNMYFQSFGAVAIVKVNSSWFHVRERGSFGGIFGVLISLGIYFAFDWSHAVVEATRVKPAQELGLFQSILRALLLPSGATRDETWWVFWVPAFALFAFGMLVLSVVRDRPSQAGFPALETGDASAGEGEEPMPLGQILKRILTNPVILTIAAIEFCSGVLRDGTLQWYRIYSKEIGLSEEFLFCKHWGLLQAIAGSLGGITAGFISDKIFGSRRGPVATLLYGVMLAIVCTMVFSLQSNYLLGTIISLMVMSVIGVHGMLSGTATMDFGGRRAAGTAVGVIDGFVYLGSTTQALALGQITSRSWSYWPVFLVPFAVVGLYLARRIWRAFPGPRKGGGH